MTVPSLDPQPLVYVRIRQRRNVATVVRGQTWFWETFGTNQKRMARSKGYHTNQDDCIASAVLHFGSATTVFLQQAEKGNVPLRWGQHGDVSGT